MVQPTDSSAMALDGLRAPLTEPGRQALELLDPHLVDLRAEAPEHDRTASLPTHLFEQMRKDGLLGVTVPAALGGVGLDSLHDVAVLLGRVARSDAGVALALHMQLSRGLTLTYEYRHGSPKARVLAERLLRDMAAGEAVVCGAVKDVRGTTTLTRAPEGWVLNGRKTLVSMAQFATHYVVAAQAPAVGEVRLVAPVVARHLPGLQVLDNWDGMGMRSSGSVDLVFEDVPIAEDHVLDRGVLGEPDDAALAGQTVSSIAMLGIYCGLGEYARDLAVESVRRRGAVKPAARTLLAQIDIRLFAMRVGAAAALVNADRLTADLSGDPAERGRRMMTPFQLAKAIVTRDVVHVVDDCLTIVGGAAYGGSHPLSRIYRDVRAGGFAHPFNFVDGVDYLTARALA